MRKDEKKQPLQERSRQTVQSILDASARILGREGVKNLNTNRIAEVAGVSVGSIYQFFKNKESILETLMTSVLDQNLEDMLKLLQEAPADGGMRPFIENLVEGVFANFDKRGVVTNTLLEKAPQLIGMKRLQKVDEKIIPMLLEIMQKRRIKIRSQDPEMALFILSQTLRGVVSMTYARKMNGAEKIRVKRELVDLCIRYLEA